MDKISKTDLVDSVFYEGIALKFDGTKETRVAKWVDDMQLFVHKVHHWAGDLTNYMSYTGEEHEYYESFKPMEEASISYDDYKIENL